MNRAASRVVHAFGDDALGDHDAVEIARRIRTGELSPAEATEAAIARAERVEPRLHAIMHELFAPAREAAGGTLQGVFAGVPVFVKDNLDLRGVPSRHGSRALDARPARADAAFVKLLQAQGVVVIGKSTLPEFGFNASTEPAGEEPTHNPWHTDHTPGGSSGGSAALVAAGVVPFAHGNDGGGSLRIPAACCGLFALKPTRGRLPALESTRKLPVNIVTDGVLTRSVRDSAHFYAAAERHFHAKGLPPIGLVEGPGKARLRVGMVLDSVEAPPTDAPTRACVLETARRLQALGHEVSELRVPTEVATLPKDFTHYWFLLAFLAARFGRFNFGPGFDPDKLDNLTRGLVARYGRQALFGTPGMLRRLRRSGVRYAEFMGAYDVVLSPVVGHTTPRLGHLSPEQPFEQHLEHLRNFACFTPLNNATGSPAMTLPLGATAEGLPIGVHFSGHHGAERTLLELAFELEQAHPWRRIQDVPPAGP